MEHWSNRPLIYVPILPSLQDGLCKVTVHALPQSCQLPYPTQVSALNFFFWGVGWGQVSHLINI